MSVAEFRVPPVVKTVTVRATPERAFNAFVIDFVRWWPLATHHNLKVQPAVDCVFEPRVGGRVYERDAAGRETTWATVLAYEPPRLLTLSWFAGNAPEAAQRVELRFTAEGAATRVELMHSGWEALGEQAQIVRGAYDRGWAIVFEQAYAGYINAAK
jgi:uncharacterized protein YndB with AHSA1/START domain